MRDEWNVKPVRSSDEARRRGRNGGIASGKARRQKRELRERLKEALDCAVVNPKTKKMMEQVGMDGDGSNMDAVVASIVVGAIQGAPGYAKLLVELIGETGAEQRAERADKREEKRLEMQLAELERLTAAEGKDPVIIVNDLEE